MQRNNFDTDGGITMGETDAIADDTGTPPISD